MEDNKPVVGGSKSKAPSLQSYLQKWRSITLIHLILYQHVLPVLEDVYICVFAHVNVLPKHHSYSQALFQDKVTSFTLPL